MTTQDVNAERHSSVEPSRSVGAGAVRAFYRALAEGDLPTVLAILGDAITWYEAPGTPLSGPEPYRGAHQVAEHVFGPLTAAVSDLAAYVVQFVELGATTAAVGVYSGTARSTGERLQVGFVHVWQSVGAQPVEFRQYTDAAQFARLIEPSPR